MCQPTDHEITRLFQEFADDRPVLWEKLMPLVLDQIKTIASRRLGTYDLQLQTTDVAHEAILKMCRWRNPGPDRRRFFGKVAAVVFQVLKDAAVKRDSEARKRKGMRRELRLSVPVEGGETGEFDRDKLLKALDGLSRLGAQGKRLHELILLHWGADLTEKEVARLLRVSESTVQKDKRRVLAFLRAEIAEGGAG